MKSLLGFVAGLLVPLAGAIAVAVVVGQRMSSDAQVGWNLVPVLAFAEDVEGGTPLKAEHLAQRRLPERFLNEAYLRPQEARAILGTPVAADSQRGDLVTRQHMVDASALRREQACVEQMTPELLEVLATAEDEALAAFVESHPEEAASAAALPPHVADEQGKVAVLVATRKLEVGARLSAGDLQARTVDAAWVSPSVVPAAAAPAFQGMQTALAVDPGEMLVWQAVRAGPGPFPSACAVAVGKAADDAVQRKAAQLAAGFFAQEVP